MRRDNRWITNRKRSSHYILEGDLHPKLHYLKYAFETVCYSMLTGPTSAVRLITAPAWRRLRCRVDRCKNIWQENWVSAVEDLLLVRRLQTFTHLLDRPGLARARPPTIRALSLPAVGRLSSPRKSLILRPIILRMKVSAEESCGGPDTGRHSSWHIDVFVICERVQDHRWRMTWRLKCVRKTRQLSTHLEA